jgi:hypothetical protein
MFAAPRRAGVLLAGLLAAGAFTAQAGAQTSKLRLHTQADTGRFLAEDPSGLTSMRLSNSSDERQKWFKTPTSGGFAIYKNAQTGHCLTGRGLQGAPVVTAEKCITSGSTTKQEWKLGVSGDLQLRLNGLVAEVNPATLTGVRMALFTAKPNQKWHTHAVS